MTKYQCDFYGCKERCPNPAFVAYDDGNELHFACEDHRMMVVQSWRDAYVINNDAMEECPVIAQNRPQTIMEAITAETLRDTAKRLVAARDERLKDRLIMHALGVRWD